MNRSRPLSQEFRWAASGVLALATLLAYWPTLAAGFIWEDDAHVTRADLQSWHGLVRARGDSALLSGGA